MSKKVLRKSTVGLTPRKDGELLNIGGIMACKYICDGCGKEESAVWFKDNPTFMKPSQWFERADEKTGPQIACSRECIAKIAEKTGVTSSVLPI